MNSVNQIEIRITYPINTNKNIELFVVPNTLKVYIHGQEKEIEAGMIDRLMDIICKWDYEYIDDSVLDATTFSVKVYTNSGMDRYFGSGKYPDNFDTFLEWIRDL